MFQNTDTLFEGEALSPSQMREEQGALKRGLRKYLQSRSQELVNRVDNGPAYLTLPEFLLLVARGCNPVRLNVPQTGGDYFHEIEHSLIKFRFVSKHPIDLEDTPRA